MRDISAIALFCDDIREEKSGAYSLIGIIGDNIQVPGFPGAIAKFAIYVRIHLDVSFEPCEFDIFLSNPSGERLLINTIQEGLVRDTIRDTAEKSNPIAGIYSHLIATPFPVPKEGRYSLELVWRSESIFLGSVNFMQSEQARKPDNETKLEWSEK